MAQGWQSLHGIFFFFNLPCYTCCIAFGTPGEWYYLAVSCGREHRIHPPRCRLCPDEKNQMWNVAQAGWTTSFPPRESCWQLRLEDAARSGKTGTTDLRLPHCLFFVQYFDVSKASDFVLLWTTAWGRRAFRKRLWSGTLDPSLRLWRSSRRRLSSTASLLRCAA